MDEQHINEFATDGMNHRYDETGLQTSNKPHAQPENQQPSGDDLKSQQTGSSTGDHNRREVTDPVTHLEISIHDATDTELERIPPPPASPQEQPESTAERKDDSDLRHDEMSTLMKEETKGRWTDYGERERRGRLRAAFVAGVATAGATVVMFLWAMMMAGSEGVRFLFLEMVAGSVGCAVLGLGAGAMVWTYTAVADDSGDVGEVAGQKKPSTSQQHKPPESAAWVNSLLSSLWPIVNPALFNSVADMLEDAMQASLPKLVKGVRVAELGQGNESMRILGIRWLEAGDAAEEKRGMAGEEGDFAHFEIAVAYRSRPPAHPSRGLRGRSRNAHLLIEFSTMGGIMFPVWVEVTGILAAARMRIQLTPNPPFLGLATLTLLGQPKVNVSCVPITKNFLNIMDVPVLNRFLQSSIDSAIGMYVAPRSLTLDLNALLTGREKMDTEAVGVVVVRVIRAAGFKDGDGGKKWLSGPMRRGDPYVTVGWGKWGKGMWSTRIIENEGEPVWDETDTMLVGPTEVGADENLRLQLWDSDRTTADDLLGVVEIPLKDIMNDDSMKNRIMEREDDLVDYEGNPCPGKVWWNVGYYSKPDFGQYLAHRGDVDVEETKGKVEREAERKLREAQGLDETGEIEQQKKEDLKERSDEIIANSGPNPQYPSGILYIGIQQIVGLEVERIRDSGVREEAEDEGGEDLPSAYCTVIINHEKVYKTRTKLKDNKPFFDASTERFIRDIRTMSLVISVRDHRTHEADPLLGVVDLPLGRIFSSRSQLVKSFPLLGGIGYGWVRLCLIFRSVYLRLPPPLAGWNTGTLEIMPRASASEGLPQGLAQCRLVFRTLYGKHKMFPDSDAPREWSWKRRDRPLCLAVCKRYASCLLIQFRKYSLGPDTTAAFAVLWLKDITDDDETEVDVLVRKGDLKRAVKSADTEGEHVGTLKLRVKFWPGLSGYHQHIAAANKNMADVMQALEAAEDAKAMGDYYSETSDSSDSSDDGDDDYDDTKRNNADQDDGKRGLTDELKEYKRNRKDMHRRHRGLMQFRTARQVAWMGHKMEEKTHELGDSLKSKLKHHGRASETQKIETEV